MDRRAKEEFCKDMERLSSMLYFASKKKSELDIDVKLEMIRKLVTKAEARRELRGKGRGWRGWDGRHWRGVDPIRDRLLRAYE